MMRKNYPYLLDTTFENKNQEMEKTNFLQEIDNFVNQKQYIKFTLLNWDEEPLKEISGEIISGSLTKDGSSSIRRTCNCTTSIDPKTYNVEDANMDFAINKKVYLEIGVKNYSNKYKEYPILWFPQGVFFVSNCSISSSSSSAISLQISLKDKMCGLNGEVGGQLPATVIFDEMDTQTPSGTFVSQKVLVYNIIQELVHHYGGEPLTNIVIEDVPKRIKQVMKWTGSNPLYMIPHANGDYLWYDVLTEKPKDYSGAIKQFDGGADVGYIYTDFIYPKELSGNLGESVVTILDRIKNFLGNYEYFYDEFGVFHFREIKNYLNTTQASTALIDMAAKNYLIDTTVGKTNYTFNDKTNIISISENPQFNNIKNDYIIQGLRKRSGSQAATMVRYHLAIDRKPQVGNVYQNLLLYEEEQTKLIKAVFPQIIQEDQELPSPGNMSVIYYEKKTDEFSIWNGTGYKKVKPAVLANKERAYFPLNPHDLSKGYKAKDWRTELYLQGLLAKNLGTDSSVYYNKIQQNNFIDNNSDYNFINQIYRQQKLDKIDIPYYFEELDAFWPQIYNLVDQCFYGEQKEQAVHSASLTDGNYFLDFIDPYSSGLGAYSVSNIGRRTDAIKNDSINCIFQPEIPNIIFINVDNKNKEELQNQKNECIRDNQPFTQVKENLYSALFLGGYKNAAFDQIKYELYIHTNYQKTVSINALPAFYLEPNTRIKINDANINIQGDFVVHSINIPLGPTGTMSVSASQCLERF